MLAKIVLAFINKI